VTLGPPSPIPYRFAVEREERGDYEPPDARRRRGLTSALIKKKKGEKEAAGSAV